MTVVRRTENRVDGAAAQPDAAAASEAAPEAISRYEQLVYERLLESPPVKQVRVEGVAPTANAAPPPDAAPPAEPASPSGAGVRPELQSASMAISRYEELVAERLGDAEAVKPAPAWRRRVIAGALLLVLAALAVVAFFWRTVAPNTPDNIAVRPPAKERAINAPVAQEMPTHTLPRSPQSTVPTPPAAAPRASVERTEPPAPLTIRTPAVTNTPAVTHTQAAAAAAVPARERAIPRTPKPASNCSEAMTALGLCGADTVRGNAR